jgi:hypothetical protein
MSISGAHSRQEQDEGVSSQPQQERRLLTLQEINIQNDGEAELLRTLTTKTYERTKTFDAFFLVKIGMLDSFVQAFDYVGWSDFYSVTEKGSILLTQEFLMTLGTEKRSAGTFINFRLFNTEFSVSPKRFAELLGFHPNCSLSEPQGYSMTNFWSEICGEFARGKHSITKIHNPSLRLLARWVSLILFPRSEVRCSPNEDLKCLYAMVKKKRYAPVHDIVRHWSGMHATNSYITITSFVTRIASNLGLLENAQLSYIPDDGSHIVGEQHFIQAHFMKRSTEVEDQLIMTWHGHNLELPLPAPQFDLYTVKSLLMQLDVEAPRQSIGGVMTRAQRRRAEEQRRRELGEDIEEEEPPFVSTPVEPSWFYTSSGQTSYQPSHSTQYYDREGGSGARYFGRNQAASASARFNTNVDDLSSGMGHMNLGHDQNLFQQVNSIFQNTETLGQQLQANTEMLQNIHEQIGTGFQNAQDFYSYYYQHHP